MVRESQGKLAFIQGQEAFKSLFKVCEKSGNFILSLLQLFY